MEYFFSDLTLTPYIAFLQWYSQETRDVLVQIRAALKTISTASAGIEEILTQTPTNFSDYCPNVNQSDSREVFRVDLAGLSDMISVDYRSFEDAVAENTTKIEKVLRTIENSVDVLEFSFHKAENMVWVIPGLLLGISVVTAFSTFGVVLAWKQDSSLRFQRLLSYGVLPVLVLLAIACWALAIGASVSTAMSAGKSCINFVAYVV